MIKEVVTLALLVAMLILCVLWLMLPILLIATNRHLMDIKMLLTQQKVYIRNKPTK